MYCSPTQLFCAKIISRLRLASTMVSKGLKIALYFYARRNRSTGDIATKIAGIALQDGAAS